MAGHFPGGIVLSGKYDGETFDSKKDKRIDGTRLQNDFCYLEMDTPVRMCHRRVKV